jgi:hypothetical protein
VKSILNNLEKIDKTQALVTLNSVQAAQIPVHLKFADQKKIYSVRLARTGQQKNFRLEDFRSEQLSEAEATLKIVDGERLFFLKTQVRRKDESYYLDGLDNFFELVRRKKPRFRIPAQWSQTAEIQAGGGPRVQAEVREVSVMGMRLKISPLIPRFEKTQKIKLRFKIYRRAELTVEAEIIHLQKSSEGGPVVGLQFIGVTNLQQSKLQSICDDLAFFYTSEAKVT